MVSQGEPFYPGKAGIRKAEGKERYWLRTAMDSGTRPE